MKSFCIIFRFLKKPKILNLAHESFNNSFANVHFLPIEVLVELKKVFSFWPSGYGGLLCMMRLAKKNYNRFESCTGTKRFYTSKCRKRPNVSTFGTFSALCNFFSKCLSKSTSFDSSEQKACLLDRVS